MTRFYDLELSKLNSLTKYPSIPTYHKLGDRGCLLEEVQVLFDGGDLLASEKIDGANSRVIFAADGDFIIGSRKELLYADGDFIRNQSLGIVDALAGIVKDIIVTPMLDVGMLAVLYFEVFGGEITHWKNYTSSGVFGVRLLDCAFISLADVDGLSVEQIAGAREDRTRTFQQWQTYEQVVGLAKRIHVKTPPQLVFDSLPTDIEDTLKVLDALLPKTCVALDSTAQGVPEGVVVRDTTRNNIAKLRFASYRRTVGDKACTGTKLQDM